MAFEPNKFSDPTANNGYYLDFYSISVQKSVQFKAFLTNFQDKYDSKWDDTDVYGRMDPMGIFKRTGRNISLGFSIPAESKEEAKNNLEKVSLLINMLYPVYENLAEPQALSMVSAPLFKLSFTNLISNSTQGTHAEANGLVGKITGFSDTINLEPGFFSAPGVLYPKEFKITFDFGVFHTHRLGWNASTKMPFNTKFPYGVDSVVSKKPESSDNKNQTQKQKAINKIVKGKK